MKEKEYIVNCCYQVSMDIRLKANSPEEAKQKLDRLHQKNVNEVEYVERFYDVVRKAEYIDGTFSPAFAIDEETGQIFILKK